MEDYTEKGNNNYTACQITIEIILDCTQFKNCDVNVISDWLQWDEDDLSCQVMSDEDIVIKMEKIESENEEGKLDDK